MADLIDREAAIAIAERYGCDNGSALGRHSGVADCIASELAKLPAVDAEKVIHCKDCRYCFDFVDKKVPWNETCGEGFHCAENEYDYYPAYYDARTYFCGDGKPLVKTSKEG